MSTEEKCTYIIVNRISYAGGAEQIAIKSALYIREIGFLVTIICISIEDDDLYNEIERSGIKIIVLEQRNYLSKGDSKDKYEKLWDQINDIYNPRIEIFIKKNIRPGSIVLAHKIRGFSPSIFKWISQLNCNVLYTTHDYEFFNYNAKIISGGYLSKLYYLLFRIKYLKYIDKILVPSQFLKNEISRIYKIDKNIEVLHNFIEDFKYKEGDIDRQFALGYFGRIEDIKGVKEFCAAAANTERKTIVVGQGSILADLKEEYKNSHFLFTGNVDKEDVLNYMRMTKVVVVPSLWNETFGLVVAEAISCGCFVLVSEFGALKEVLNLCPNRGRVISKSEIVDKSKFSEILKETSDKVNNLYINIDMLTISNYHKKLMELLDNVKIG
ncbi:glycosyltransferase [Aestuariibacter sp. GS-14]|uniref:glycosyltransferase n=1 Tax=Aestuariibacter sp. GS-14 TaxID=2590670 RepID=UPI00112AE831|nr:glycosyltransferase [Aestuariibacter sp. GS-14]TPV53843.1 glycosyltransferase [Aestuariibacter sp. GS-14]